MTSLRPKATFGSILKHKHEICSMPTTKFPAVAAALCTILAAGSLSAKAPIFMPVKVDGPVHAPEKGSFWYGPFAEGSAGNCDDPGARKVWLDCLADGQGDGRKP